MSVDRYWEYVELGLANVIQTTHGNSHSSIALDDTGAPHAAYHLQTAVQASQSTTIVDDRPHLTLDPWDNWLVDRLSTTGVCSSGLKNWRSTGGNCKYSPDTSTMTMIMVNETGPEAVRPSR
ncbi:unnamed protein product [Aspergillus oryzae]|nr:unnamed protein product [Aspergillus oryzae]GMF88376.1 unnamed protein product [Aspergillus oryzae]